MQEAQVELILDAMQEAGISLEEIQTIATELEV